MANIHTSTQLRKNEFPGVVIHTLGATPKVGVPQEVLVQLAPGMTIPLHSHSVDARMIIVSGGGVVLSQDATMNGRTVGPGDVVFFDADVPHGFAASAVGLTFLSQNGGIVDQATDAWDVAF